MFGIRGKHAFFDSARILAATTRATVETLAQAGAYVRRTAKGLIRPGRKPSQPGKPPHSHTNLLRDRIFFGFDETTGEMIVGPEKTNQVFFNHAGEPVTGAIPEILEQPEGGDIQVLEVQRQYGPRKGQWVRADLRSKRRLAGRPMRLRKAHVRSRPFMRPALDQNVDKFKALWGDVITE
jgi:hypothetical protein